MNTTPESVLLTLYASVPTRLLSSMWWTLSRHIFNDHLLQSANTSFLHTTVVHDTGARHATAVRNNLARIELAVLVHFVLRGQVASNAYLSVVACSWRRYSSISI
jgi:hypothetical protein